MFWSEHRLCSDDGVEWEIGKLLAGNGEEGYFKGSKYWSWTEIVEIRVLECREQYNGHCQ